jgi:peroxiredoxin
MIRIVYAIVLLFFLHTAARAQHPALRLPLILSADSTTIDIAAVSDSTPVIAIRFLGSMCTHCMQQLVKFQEYTSEFRASGARIIAFSENDVEKCLQVTRQYQLARDVFSLCSDVDNKTSRALGTTIYERNGSVTELHGILVLHKRAVIFEHYSTSPYMDHVSILQIITSVR